VVNKKSDARSGVGFFGCGWSGKLLSQSFKHGFQKQGFVPGI
jgi:hypothetical protein